MERARGQFHCRELPCSLKVAEICPPLFTNKVNQQRSKEQTLVEEFGITGERCQAQGGFAGSWKGWKVVRYA